MRKPSQNIEEMLESDEELPTEYSEIAELPAYLNDNRFESQCPVEIQWIDNNFSKYYLKKQKSTSTYFSSITEDGVFLKTKNLDSGERLLILNGVLNQQDIYCLKSIQPLTGDDTLLWFLKFLLIKDLQSNTKFLKTCLVCDSLKYPIQSSNNLLYLETRKYYFDIVNKNLKEW